MYKVIEISTEKSECLINITKDIQEAVSESGFKEGTCILFVPHTTAAITINSCMDEMTLVDIVSETKRLIPTRVDFNHIYDTPSDAAGHIKSVFIGNSLTLIIHDGKLVLGGSQSILFYEFDGPRNRRVVLHIS